MPELQCVIDSVGYLPEEGSRKVRVLVDVTDGPPARLVVFEIIDRTVCRTEVDLVSVSFSRFTGWRLVTADAVLFYRPMPCDCGGGRLAFLDPAPGYDIILVRLPRWIEEDVTV